MVQMREIFVNGVAFRYKSERDLGIILHNARQPARLKPLCELLQEARHQRRIKGQDFNELVGTSGDVLLLG